MYDLWRYINDNLNNLVTPIILVNESEAEQGNKFGGGLRCFMKIKGREFIKYLLETLYRTGFTRTILCVGFKCEIIANYLGNKYNGMDIIYSFGGKDLGMGGAIVNALKSTDTPYLLVLNSESFSDISITQFILYSILNVSDISVVSTLTNDCSGHTRVLFDESNRIFDIKDTDNNTIPEWVNAGIYLFRRELLYNYPYYGGILSLEKNVLPYYLSKNVFVFFTRSLFISMGNPDDLSKVSKSIDLMNSKRVIVILDRDGTIIEDKVYLNDPRNIEFIANAIRGINLLNNNNITVVIGTNQSGIGRGIIKQNQLIEIHNRLMYYLAKEETAVDGIYYCPHIPEDNCECRKPNVGMFRMIKSDFPRIKDVYVIGDSLCDLQFAKNIGARMYLINNKKCIDEMDHIMNENEVIIDDIYEAAMDVIKITREKVSYNNNGGDH